MNNEPLILTIFICVSFGTSLLSMNEKIAKKEVTLNILHAEIENDKKEEALNVLRTEIPESLLYKKCSKKCTESCITIATFLQGNREHINSRNKIKQSEKKLPYDSDYDLSYLEKLEKYSNAYEMVDSNYQLSSLNGALFSLLEDSDNYHQETTRIMDILKK